MSTYKKEVSIFNFRNLRNQNARVGVLLSGLLSCFGIFSVLEENENKWREKRTLSDKEHFQADFENLQQDFSKGQNNWYRSLSNSEQEALRRKMVHLEKRAGLG